MSCPGHELLLELEQDLIDDAAEAERLRVHRDGCADCQARLAALKSNLEPPPLPFDPAVALAGIHERLAEQRAAEAAAEPVPPLEVQLRCTYCRDGLSAEAAVYCAGCLAPHHDDCFAEHGRCAAPGCEGTDVVRRAEPPQQPPRDRVRGAVVILLAAAFGTGVTAALVGPGGGEPPALQQTAPKPAPPAELELVRVDYPVGDLIGPASGSEASAPATEPEWVAAMRAKLASRTVTLNFPDTPVSEVVSFLTDITGLNFTAAPEVDEELTVSLRLKDVRLDQALELILEQTGLVMSFASQAIVISPREGVRRIAPAYPAQRPEPAAAPPEREQDPQAELIDLVRSAVADALGPDAWSGAAGLAVQDDVLAVWQTPAGHKAVVAALARMRPARQARDLLGAWFAPAGRPFTPPAEAKARDYARQLQAPVSLNMDETPLVEALAFLNDLTEVPLRLGPDVQALADREELTVSLRLKDVTLENALLLVAASASDRLQVDVDRWGALLRTGATPPLERRLADAAPAPEPADDPVQRRLTRQTLSVSFNETPLADVLDFFRDITGLNIVAAPDVDGAATVTLQARNVALGQALEAVARPLGLVVRVDGGVVRIVPGGQAAVGSDLAALVATANARPVPQLVGADLGQVVQTLEDATGAAVVLSQRALHSRARVALPEGSTVEAALGLLFGEARLRARWSQLLPEGRLVLTLEQAGAEPLLRALEVLVEGSPLDPANVGAAKALAEARASLGAALRRLAARGTAADADALKLALSEAARASDRLEDVLAGHALLAAAPQAEALEEGERLLGELHAHGGMVRAAQLQHEGDRRRLQAALVQAEDALRRLAADYGAGEARRRAAIDALREEALAGSGDARARLTALEDTALEAARRYDPERRRLQAAKDEALDTLTRSQRDHALEMARLQSVRSQLRARLLEGRFAPAGSRALVAKREALAAGGAWDEAFPKGARVWAATASERALQRLRGGFRALGFLGLESRREGDRPAVLWVTGGGVAAGAGLQDGDAVLAVGGEPCDGPLDLIERLGDPRWRGSPPRLKLERPGAAPFEVQLPVAAVFDDRRGSLNVVLREPSPGEVVVGEPLEGAPPGSPLQAGDRLLAVGDVAVGSRRQLEDVLSCWPVGSSLTVRVSRGGAALMLAVPFAAPVTAAPDGAPPAGQALPDPAAEAQPEDALNREPPLIDYDRVKRRADLAARGGTPQTEAAVDAALAWLVLHQEPDGHWSSAGWQAGCERAGHPTCSGPGTDRGDARYDVGQTALAVLALLARGQGPYGAEVGRATGWLLKQANEDGSIGFDRGETIYNHALATEALAEAFAIGGDPTLETPLRRAVAWCVQAQNPNLGWKYGVRTGRNDTSVTGVMTQALLAARRAGVEVPEEAWAGATRWLTRVTNARGEVGYQTPGGGSSFLNSNDGKFTIVPTMTAVGMATWASLAFGPDPAAARRSCDLGARALAGTTPATRGTPSPINFYYWHWGTRALVARGGPTWQQWNAALQDALLTTQRRDGAAAGSWDPVGEWCLAGGRVYATALNALTLQAYYR